MKSTQIPTLTGTFCELRWQPGAIEAFIIAPGPICYGDVGEYDRERLEAEARKHTRAQIFHYVESAEDLAQQFPYAAQSRA